MKLSSKARYAVMAMADLAARDCSDPVTLAQIAGRQAISQSYLEQLFVRLRRAGLVKSVRGPGGGYCLARPSEAISVNDVIRAVTPPIRATRCGGEAGGGCLDDDRRCATHDLWQALGDHINLFLESVSLADVVEGRLAPARPCARLASRPAVRPAAEAQVESEAQH